VGAFSERIAKVKMGLCGRFFTAKTENVFGYSLLLDCDEYSVYKRPIGSRRIEAAYGTVVIVSKKNKLFIYPDYRYPQISYKVVFNKNVFPGLIEGSRISYCRVIPYFRYISKKNKVKAWRLIVVTNRGQIYHNYPSRFSEFDGASSVDDIKRFEESVVWDLPGRKYPCDRKEHAQYERYFPGLPEAAYQYHPDVNKSGAYSNGGFPAYRETAEGVLSRFYIPCRVPEANPFFYMSGFSADYKMALIGTYCSNVSVGVRTCVFASDDGGRQWYCKYEFGDEGEYPFRQGTAEWGRNFGNPIINKSEASGKVVLSKRKNIIPNAENKEPTEKFSWAEGSTFSIKEEADVLTLLSDECHGLETGNIVSVLSAPAPLDWMVNCNVDSRTAGNGVLFKVDVIDEKTVKLYEFVASAENPISCRHIHHINRVRDGWLVGTGEIYPNSWLLYVQMKEADTFSERRAEEPFEIFRLNSTENSVQRTLGTIWYENSENTVLFASDHDILGNKSTVKPICDRSIEFSRGATGVYKGKLEDIDDYNRFIPVFEATEPAYLSKSLTVQLSFQDSVESWL